MSDPAVARAAEAIWFRHLSREIGGATTGFEQLCAAHPRLAGELARLKDDWERTSGAHAAAGEARRPLAQGQVSSALARLEQLRPQVSKYEVRGELGRGGMGVVQRVWDASLRRELARKTMHRSLGPARAQALARFLEEAQILAQLDHPAIVPIHDLGLDEHDRPFFVMKLVVGRDLGAVYELAREAREGWTTTRAVAVLLRVCEAVGYAHSKGVVHRDLKPSNVMVGTLGEVYVMDWGIARVSQASGEAPIETVRSAAPTTDGPDSLHTGHGDVVGTAAYMAPEQARGELDKVTARSDVYALGAMLYHLLAGRAPYARPGAASRALLLALLAGPPPPLDEAAPGAPLELLAICAKCMAREPEKRYADLVEVADDLRAYLEGRVVRAHKTGAWTESVKWVKRNKALSASIGGVVAVSLAGAGSYFVQAEIGRQRLSDFEVLAAQDAVDELVVRADELWPPSPELLGAYDRWIEDACAQIEGRAGVEGATSGLAAHRAALASLRGRAKPLSAEQLEDERRSHPRWSELETKRAELLWRDRLLGVEPWPNEADARAERAEQLALVDVDVLLRLARACLGSDLRHRGEEVQARLLAERALQIAKPEHLGLAHGLLSLALLKLGRWDESLEHARRAHELGGAEDVLRLEPFEAAVAVAREPVEQVRRRVAVAAEVAELETQVSERRSFEYDDALFAAWDMRLATLVESLEHLQRAAAEDGEQSSAGSVAQRRELVLSTYDASIHSDDAVSRWSEALESIRSSERYGGLELRPQFGLLPLGADPHSGLWEFAHLPSGEAPRRSVSGELEVTASSSLVLVLVPGGRFNMGAQSDDECGLNYDPDVDRAEFPVHAVELAPFFISKYEATTGQWRRMTPGASASMASEADSDALPVVSVSWRDSEAHLARAGLLLPTEAQWEYACRAGTSTPHWSGSSPGELSAAANLYDRSAREMQIGSFSVAEEWFDGHGLPAPVGSFHANSFGLHDTSGNVFEWCRDAYGDYSLPLRNGDGLRETYDDSARVLRGGAFSADAWHARSSFRMEGAPDYSTKELGARPVRAVEL
jgi:formylglycine-generating enzyme required for sulfatase activity